MNSIIQNILVITALALALGFIVRKFIWKPKSKTTKACGTTDDNCGCH